MATVTGFTSTRMLQIEQQAIINGAVDLAGRLHLTTRGGTVIDAGMVKGEKGDVGSEGPRGLDANYYAIRIPTNTNLNTIETPGFYVQPFTAQAITSLNYPAIIAGMLEVTRAEDRTEVYQRYTDYLTNRVWIRSRSNAVWTSWSIVLVDSNVWTPLVISSTHKQYSTSYPCAWKQVGNRIELKGLIGLATGAAYALSTAYATVFTLPVGARPSQSTFLMGSTTTGQSPVTIVVNSGGTVDFRIANTAASYVGLDSCYFYI